MATETSKMSKTAKLIIGLLIILVAILFWLVLREPARQANSFLGGSVSIRQDQDKIQWKSSNSDWQTITTVSQLTTGQQGKPSKDGSNGKDGTTGAQGAKGDTGATGATGRDGAKGETGATGANGANGTDGATGATGLQGAKGDTGATGAAGADGKDGAKGDTGATGAAGINGINGTNGTNGTNGNDGREIELQKDLYYIQWRYVGEAGWRNLIAYSDLKGEKGDTGATGLTGPANSLSIGTVNRTACTPTATITGTAPSQTLNLGIPGLPAGGTAGQILQKNSNDDCDTVWANQNVIVGAGRPDITNTMDAATQAKVTSATSGTEFRSTDGPQGAWVWMKQGSKWVVTSGDTGSREMRGLTINGWTVNSIKMRRIGNLVSLVVTDLNGSAKSAAGFLEVPDGFRPQMGAYNTNIGFLQNGSLTSNPDMHPLKVSGNNTYDLIGTPPGMSWGLGVVHYMSASSWPTTLPGAAF